MAKKQVRDDIVARADDAYGSSNYAEYVVEKKGRGKIQDATETDAPCIPGHCGSYPCRRCCGQQSDQDGHPCDPDVCAFSHGGAGGLSPDLACCVH